MAHQKKYVFHTVDGRHICANMASQLALVIAASGHAINVEGTLAILHLNALVCALLSSTAGWKKQTSGHLLVPVGKALTVL